MTPKIEPSIWLALRERIETLPFSPCLPIAWPAATYSPEDGRDFLAVGRVTVAPQRVLVGRGPHERTGTLIISHVGQIGQDVAVYDQMAGIIADHFPAGLSLKFGAVCVKITASAHVEAGYRDGGWWRTPVIIPWRCAA